MKRNFQEWPRKNGAILHFRTPFCYWQLIMKKHGLILYSSPNPNPVVVRKCNNSAKNIMWCGISRGIGFCFWLWNFQKGSNTTLCNFQGWKFVLSPISRGKVKKMKNSREHSKKYALNHPCLFFSGKATQQTTFSAHSS